MGHDRPELDLTADEEVWHQTMLGLSTNEHGERTLVGLTVEESVELNTYHRYFFGKRKKHSSREERTHYRELNEKFEAARHNAFVAAERRRHGAVLTDDVREARQQEAAMKVVKLATALTDALEAARKEGVPMVIQVDDIAIGKQIHTHVLARMLAL